MIIMAQCVIAWIVFIILATMRRTWRQTAHKDMAEYGYVLMGELLVGLPSLIVLVWVVAKE